MCLDIVGDEDEGYDMDCKLTEDGTDDVRIENVWLRTLL